jgi:cell wall-associated NlpC family hydrolase
LFEPHVDAESAWMRKLLCLGALALYGCAGNKRVARLTEPLAAPAAPPQAIAARYEPPPPAQLPVVESSAAPRAEPAAEATTGERIAKRASSLVGTKSLKQITRRVHDDCSGFIKLVYESEGVPLADLPPTDSAVVALYRKSRTSGALRKRAEPGDLVFFRDTYDRNRDGLRNDGLTHVGIVESVEDDGTVVFVHRGRAGIVRARMNALRPRNARVDGKPINDVLRRPTRTTRAYLAGELFAGFASAERIGTPLVASARRPEGRRRPHRK